MVAQAEQVAPEEEVANDLLSEETVSKKNDDDDDGHGGDDKAVDGRTQRESSAGIGKAEPVEETKGFDLEEEEKVPIEPESPGLIAGRSTIAQVPDEGAGREDVPVLENPFIKEDSSTPPAQEVSTTVNENDTTTGKPPVPETSQASAPSDLSDPALLPDSSATKLDTKDTLSATTPDDPSTASPAAEPASVPFPQMTRMNTSHSTHSNLSDADSGASTSDVAEPAPAEGKDKEKRRTRLSSIKGFVRRISDQRSTRSPGRVGRTVSDGKSPVGEMDEATAMLSASLSASGSPNGEAGDKKKKRLSLKKQD